MTCRWDDAMQEASTLGLPCPRPAGYGKDVRAYQRLCEQRRKQQRAAKSKRKPKS